MLKKIFYIGLGISIIAVKKSVSYFLEKREQAGDQPAADLTVEEVVVSQSDATDTPESDRAQQVADEVDPAAEGGATASEADDLTRINGIGPTYAKRLKDAGISTFAGLSSESPEELRLITKATGKSADAESWIVQASNLA